MRRAGSSAPFFIAHYFFYLDKKFIDSVGNQLFEKSRILGFRALCLWVEVISVDCEGVHALAAGNLPLWKSVFIQPSIPCVAFWDISVSLRVAVPFARAAAGHYVRHYPISVLFLHVQHVGAEHFFREGFSLRNTQRI